MTASVHPPDGLCEKNSFRWCLVSVEYIPCIRHGVSLPDFFPKEFLMALSLQEALAERKRRQGCPVFGSKSIGKLPKGSKLKDFDGAVASIKEADGSWVEDKVVLDIALIEQLEELYQEGKVECVSIVAVTV